MRRISFCADDVLNRKRLEALCSFLHGSDIPLLTAFRRKKPGADAALPTTGWFIVRNEYAQEYGQGVQV
ncbi:MAG TPA: hypothetical protein DCZ91_10425 [Lachnospiraceae bacterium]|nr:hypothetical protein [Lachnospiraceae bacterium]